MKELTKIEREIIECKTIFKIEDTIFFLHGNEIKSAVINAVKIEHFISAGINIEYRVMLKNRSSDLIWVKKAFADKTDLIKYLLE